MSDDHFLSRWSRRKAEVKAGREPVPEVTRPAPAVPPVAGQALPAAHAAAAVDVEPAVAAPLPPTLDDVALLTRDSSYARFVMPGVDPLVRNAAMKKLFSDPHFNVMDGLDTYIEDYGIPDPIPLAMLRQMTQSKALGLFAEEEAEEARQAAAAAAGPGGNVPDTNAAVAAAAVPSEPAESPPDEDPDLRLQQDDGAGRPGAGPGAGDPAAA